MFLRLLLPALVAASAFASTLHLDRRGHHYTKQQKLGSGGFGEVYSAVDENGRQVALKCLLRKGEDAEMRKEFSFQSVVRDPHVLLAYEITDVGGETCMAIELAPGGSLQDHLSKGIKHSEEQAKEYAKSLLSGLAAIHRAGLAHRDIKPGNTLITADGTVKISDFGLSCYFDHRSDEKVRNGRGGTPGYKAPEMAGSEPISDPRPVDVYAMGISIWQLLIGDSAKSFDRKKTRVQGLANDLLFKMTDPNPTSRITAEAALNHPWFTGIQKLPEVLIPKPSPVKVPGKIVQAPVSEDHHHKHHGFFGLHLFHHKHHDDDARSARH
jgi:serine/threonine protein kinase